MAVVYLSLGTNLGNKIQNLLISHLYISKKLGSVKLKSKFYNTPAWGYSDNNLYINQVLKIETLLKPDKLLEQIQVIEKSIGRVRNQSDGYTSRIIDIDILFYDKRIVDTDNLTIPHKFIHLRKFVLHPLHDIAPELMHPVFNKTIAQLLKQCSDTSEITLVYPEKETFNF